MSGILALCGVDAPVPVPRSSVPGTHKDCRHCLAEAQRQGLKWGDIVTVRKRHGSLAHQRRQL